MKYTYIFTGEVTVIANTEREAFELADRFVGVNGYQAENGVSIGELQLVDVEEDE